MKYDQPSQPSANNHKYPLVYEALKQMIKAINSDFEYNSITLNHNLKRYLTMTKVTNHQAQL